MAQLRLPRPGLSAIYWKDFHFTFGGKPWFVARLLLYPALILAIAWKAEPNDLLHFIGQSGLILALGALYLDTSIFVARSWSSEIFDRNLPQLSLVPLSLRRLHLEKAIGIAVAAIPPLVVIVASFIVSVRLPEYSRPTSETCDS
jgi:hypothetical protein